MGNIYEDEIEAGTNHGFFSVYGGLMRLRRPADPNRWWEATDPMRRGGRSAKGVYSDSHPFRPLDTVHDPPAARWRSWR